MSRSTHQKCIELVLTNGWSGKYNQNTPLRFEKDKKSGLKTMRNAKNSELKTRRKGTYPPIPRLTLEKSAILPSSKSPFGEFGHP